MKLTFNQSMETTITNKELTISPDGGTTFISNGDGGGGCIGRGDGGSVGIKPSDRCEP